MDLSKDSDSPQIVALQEDVTAYLLTPFSKERIDEASNLPFPRTQSERAADLTKLLSQLETLLSKSPKLAIQDQGGGYFLSIQQISQWWRLRQIRVVAAELGNVSTPAVNLNDCG